MPDTATKLAVLRATTDALHDLVAPLSDADLEQSAYPTEWNVAQVMSHLGSGAVMYLTRIDNSLAGTTSPDDFMQAVWDEWNGKSPRQQADDGLAVTEACTARFESLTDDERARLEIAFGPMTVDADTAVGLRMNEVVLHTWDIVVARDPSATLSADAAAAVVDNLEFMLRFVAKPTGATATITVGTTGPERAFGVVLTPEAASVESAYAGSPVDLMMPAEAFVRLVYGRLDADHTPPSVEADPATLDELRRVFPGV